MSSDLEFTIDELSFLCGVLLSEIVKCRDKKSNYYDTLRRLSIKTDGYRNYLKTLRESPIGDRMESPIGDLQTSVETPAVDKSTELEDIKRTVSELIEAVKKLEQRNDVLDGTVKKLTQVVNGVTLYNRRYK